jgi:hypothetical protein
MREAPKARARRNRVIPQIPPADSAGVMKPVITDTLRSVAIPDSIATTDSIADSSIADSIAAVNKRAFEEVEAHVQPLMPVDTVVTPVEKKKLWIPDSSKATWFAVVFPGGGQIYNRKFWKLPIIYGGFAGCAYALNWNNRMYKDYAQAYLDIMDSDPSTDSYLDLFPNRVTNYSDSQLKDLLKKRKDTFRRYRDLSIFAFIGVYLISIVDAYVDAELSNFDITPDLSMRIEPTMIENSSSRNSKSVGLQCSLRF